MLGSIDLGKVWFWEILRTGAPPRDCTRSEAERAIAPTIFGGSLVSVEGKELSQKTG